MVPPTTTDTVEAPQQDLVEALQITQLPAPTVTIVPDTNPPDIHQHPHATGIKYSIGV